MFVLNGIADHEKVVTTLENYCLALFQAQMEHTKERLGEYLTLHGLTEHGWPVTEAAQQRMTFNITVEGAQNPVTVQMPEGLVQMAPAAPPEVTVNVPAPNVTVEVDVELGLNAAAS